MSTPRKIDVDPEIWRRTRLRAYEEGTTATAIVNEALEAFLAGPTKARSKNSDGAPRSARPPRVEVGGVIEESHEEGGVRVIDRMTVTEVSIVADPQEDPWKDMGKPKLITTPEEAAKVVADIHAIHPVPKPGARTRKPRR